MRKVLLLLAFSAAILLPAFGQGNTTARNTDARKIHNDFVQQQFGADFTLVPEVAAVFGDLDGDGVEDVVIAARCKNPLPNQAEHNYTVMDPYYDFFGYGDPKVTTTFSEADPQRRGLGVLFVYVARTPRLRLANADSKYVSRRLPTQTL